MPPTLTYSVPPSLPAVKRADHRERREVDALRAQAGPPGGFQQPLDHVAARGHEHHSGPGTFGRLDDTERLVLEHGLVKGHRDVFLGLKSHRGGDLLVIAQGRQIERAHDDPLICHPETNATAKLVLGEQRAEHVSERVHVHDLALADHAGRERGRRGTLDSNLTRTPLYGGDVARFDVKPYDGLRRGVSHDHQLDRRFHRRS